VAFVEASGRTEAHEVSIDGFRKAGVESIKGEKMETVAELSILNVE
jgi:hypothetical protein